MYTGWSDELRQNRRESRGGTCGEGQGDQISTSLVIWNGSVRPGTRFAADRGGELLLADKACKSISELE